MGLNLTFTQAEHILAEKQLHLLAPKLLHIPTTSLISDKQVVLRILLNSLKKCVVMIFIMNGYTFQQQLLSVSYYG